MLKNSDFTDEYLNLIEKRGGAADERRASFDYMKNSTAIVHHMVVASSFVPRLFNQHTYDVMRESSEMTHRILCKVITRYLEDPDYRNLFDFDERLEKLILLPRGYDSILPFARIDTFIDEDTYDVKFCEFNGDGSAGMNENREITKSIIGSDVFKEFASNHKVEGCSLFDPWVDDFIRIYGTYENKVDSPVFAICDYLENGVVDEFYVYADLFEKRGFPCRICDVRDLSFDGESLRDKDGTAINAIWRRCVTNDVIEFWDDSQDLIEAVAHQKVALIGSFAGHIVHDKQIFDVILKDETLSFLDAEEAEFLKSAIPRTEFLDDRFIDVEQVRREREAWIIKPSDHYGADNVYAGCEVSQQEWDSLIGRFANGRAGYPFIVQQYIRPFKTKTLPPDFGIDSALDDQVSFAPQMYNNLNGLYLYDGKFQGVFSRLGPFPTISKQNGGMTTATIWVDADVSCGLGL